ncbi:hypothetical protein ACFW2Y_25680 [Streptomyces sp. NPDC058877]|uniref:hypothetical protein n=1 Tax=unclassified Streptomyces TaxID=2593676 RepID=UPI0036A4F1F0
MWTPSRPADEVQLEVLVGSAVPVDDGGINVGLAVVVAARLARGHEGKEAAACVFASQDA